MRSGNWRGVTLALGLACALAAPCRADLFHTIPDLVPAVDVNTGGPYYAPPIPYGHYAGKNVGGHLKKLCGMLHPCGLCGGNGCNSCGNSGRCGLFHGGNGLCGNGNGHCGNGNGLCGNGNGPCGNGNGLCGQGGACGGTVNDNGHGHGHGGLFHKCGSGCFGHASTVVVPTAQSMPAPVPSAQCGRPGCGLFGHHRHKGCGLCGGSGCGNCAVNDPGAGNGPCSSCGGKGCGLCGGLLGKGGCGLCGGRGCSACAKARGMVNHLLGRDRIKWFTGPGGPVPLTPGYTPYIVTTRSPRDFFAFPPMTP